MKREWTPGDIAIIQISKGRDHGVAQRANNGWRCVADNYLHLSGDVSDARPVDPEDREQVERLFLGYMTNGNTDTSEIDDMRAALRSLIAPPKPPEPQGLGAVIEDADEIRWLCNRFDPSIPWSKPWFSSDLDEWRDYANINAVRVLSEGVTA